MIPSVSASILSLILLLAPQLASATCYWQNSTLAPDDPYSIAPDDTACFPDQDNSPCCGTGWTCLSDGVCFIREDETDFYYRGTCTDRTWDSQQCPGWCFAQNSNTSIPLAKCDTAQDWFCCPGDADCNCDTGKNVVKLGATQPSTVTVIGSTSWPGYTSTTSPFTASALVSDGTTTDTHTQVATTSSSSGTNSATTTTGSSSATGSAAAASASSSTAAVSSGSGSSNIGLAAGLGAGLGAAAVLIGVLVFFLLRNRRKKNLAKVGSHAGYNGIPSSSAAIQKPFYSDGHPAALYTGDASMDGGTQYKPELAGQGEHNVSEMSSGSQGQIMYKNQRRAELDAS
ncbi:hypothetical protein LTR46_001319 [Exophiala xenobiotica]|nr:hypothetical protein LTR18_004103 [Exophiala xenobiotica]KAK5561009.1 hypothetical protein LTR46_001319 [Exophiala xenobiotica]